MRRADKYDRLRAEDYLAGFLMVIRCRGGEASAGQIADALGLTTSHATDTIRKRYATVLRLIPGAPLSVRRGWGKGSGKRGRTAVYFETPRPRDVPEADTTTENAATAAEGPEMTHQPKTETHVDDAVLLTPASREGVTVEDLSGPRAAFLDIHTIDQSDPDIDWADDAPEAD